MPRVSLNMACCGLLLSAAACGAQSPPPTTEPVDNPVYVPTPAAQDPPYIDLELDISDIELEPEPVLEPDIPPIELPDPDFQ